MTSTASNVAPEELEASADDAIAACDGDAKAAVKVLLVALDHAQTELAAREAELTKLLLDLSKGYSRGRWEALLTRLEQPHPSKREA